MYVPWVPRIVHKTLTPGLPVGRPPVTGGVTGQKDLCLCAFFFPELWKLLRNLPAKLGVLGRVPEKLLRCPCLEEQRSGRVCSSTPALRVFPAVPRGRKRHINIWHTNHFSVTRSPILPAGYLILPAGPDPDGNVYVFGGPHTAHKLLTPGHRSGDPPPTWAVTGKICFCVCAFSFPEFPSSFSSNFGKVGLWGPVDGQGNGKP